MEFNQSIRTKLTHKGTRIQIRTPYEIKTLPIDPMLGPEENHRTTAIALIDKHLSREAYTLASAWIDIEDMLEAVHIVQIKPPTTGDNSAQRAEQETT